LLKGRYGDLYYLRFMNYLAHAYLSMNQPDILLGNMISDFVKGKKINDYPSVVQKGIRFHRSIDSFTDAHASTKAINRFFHADYRLYSAAFTDVTYDFFLANDHAEFPTSEVLESFSKNVYAELALKESLFPPVFQQMFPYMRAQNWLYNYRQEWGIERSFAGLARRAMYITESETAYKLFLKHRDEMKVHYDIFFPMLKQYCLHTLDELLHRD
jgi:acyl carrier protein phosphodiesterase